MDKLWGYIIDILLILLIVFVCVAVYFGLKQESIIRTLANNITEDFVSDIKANGQISFEDYDNFLDKLTRTGALYDITFEHKYSILEPEYRLRTIEEVLAAQSASYTGSNVYHYRDVVTTLPVVSDPVNNGSLNTETNESILASAVNTPASASHMHADGCYIGTKHIHTGNAISGGGCYSPHVHIGNYFTGGDNTCYKVYHSHSGNSSTYGGCFTIPIKHSHTYSCSGACGGTTATGVWALEEATAQSCSICGEGGLYKSSYSYTYYCDKCGAYAGSSGEYIEGCTHGHGTMPSSTRTINCTNSVYICGYTEGQLMFYATSCGYNSGWNLSCSKLYDLTCGKTEGTYYNGNIPSAPVCSQMVSSVSATHSVQTVAIGDPLITTVRATYLDGSTKVVLAATTYTASSIVQNQPVTLTYSYTVGGMSYSKTTTMTITVIPRSKTCARGHTYNLNANGSDPGCPYCRAYVNNIRITNPATSTMSITIGTTLQANSLTLLITYMDGHTETITNGYDDNLDTAYLGTKIVTIGYKGVNVQLMVTTVCAKTHCTICGYEYDLYPDGTDPGCPRCISETPVFTGNVLTYEETAETNKILEQLYSDGVYEMGLDDTFTVSLVSKSSDLARGILRKVFPSLSNRWFILRISEKIKAK